MMKEHELKNLGIFRISLPIPFRQAGGPVNAYIIEEEDGLLLFDPGLGTEPSKAALAEGFAQTGHRFDEVNRIVLSHGHIDHFGAAAWVLQQAGRTMPVMIHNADSDKVLQSGPDWPALLRGNSRHFTKLGVPLPLLEETAAGLVRSAELGRRLVEVLPLVAGDQFRCKHVTLEVHHTPGHTTGVCCLYERTHRLLFSADHLLERVSPNPIIDLKADGEPSGFKPLITYFESLNRVRSLAVDLVLPGHAEPFSNCMDVIDSLSAFYQRRQAKILDILGRGGQTVYEVMKELFLSAEGFELILMISETLGNIEVLEAKGEIEREMKGAYFHFRVSKKSRRPKGI
jgi:glyoxylase-like metal-dependent hydrolase (beta-lactamase superfamily II)